MCLLVEKNSKVKKAKKDIVVYKAAFTRKNPNAGYTTYLTPFRFEYIKRNTLLTIDNKIKKIKANDYYKVEEGFHSFINLLDVHKVSFCYDVIFKCIIPKGSSYIEGEFDKIGSIVSDQLIYEEIV